MTTLASSTLAVPEDVIVGSGSYVIPANRYGHFNATASMAASSVGTPAAENNGSTGTGSGSASATNCTQWVTEGDSITVASRTQSTSSSSTASNVSTTNYHYRIINLNGIAQAAAYASHSAMTAGGSGVSKGCIGNAQGTFGWSVALYRIPKANLPTGAAEGE